jgi:hypothetical protein
MRWSHDFSQIIIQRHQCLNPFEPLLAPISVINILPQFAFSQTHHKIIREGCKHEIPYSIVLAAFSIVYFPTVYGNDVCAGGRENELFSSLVQHCRHQCAPSMTLLFCFSDIHR